MNGRDLVASARELVPLIAAEASRRDLEREFGVAEIDLLRKAGVTAARVPTSLGGPGASFPELAEMTIALGEADPNIAQSLQPHFAVQEVLRMYASPSQQGRYLGEIRDGAIITNALAERGGKFIGEIATRATVTDGGYYINGTKYYCTGSFVADSLWTLSGSDIKERMIAFVPIDREGVVLEDDWDAMGQRTTASGTVRLCNVFVTEDEIIRAEILYTARNYVGAAAQILHTAIDTGIAFAAFHDAVEYARNRGRPAPESGVDKLRDDPYVLETIGQMRVQAVGARAVVLSAAETLETVANLQLEGTPMNDALERQLAEASVAVAEAKIASTRASLKNSELLFQVGGASMAARTLNFDRHWRNARTHTVHDPLSYKYKAIGDFYLRDRYPVIGTKI